MNTPNTANQNPDKLGFQNGSFGSQNNNSKQSLLNFDVNFNDALHKKQIEKESNFFKTINQMDQEKLTSLKKELNPTFIENFDKMVEH